MVLSEFLESLWSLMLLAVFYGVCQPKNDSFCALLFGLFLAGGLNCKKAGRKGYSIVRYKITLFFIRVLEGLRYPTSLMRVLKQGQTDIQSPYIRPL